MVEEIVLTDMDLNLTSQSLLEKINFTWGGDEAERVEQMAAEAVDVASPKGLYRIAYIDSKSEDGVTIAGVTFTSRVLRVNLADAQRVFPFVVTCGQELAEWALKYEDVLENYLADNIMEIYLDAARDFLEQHISDNYNPGKISKMNPGSLKDWPLSEQTSLFELLGDVTGKIGVELTRTYLMKPIKSTSGIWFPSEVDYKNCQLCPRQDCPSRKAEYQEGLYQQQYQDG